MRHFGINIYVLFASRHSLTWTVRIAETKDSTMVQGYSRNILVLTVQEQEQGINPTKFFDELE